ncbi:MAG: hypothetical protein JWO11_4079, partial [Nocardioides sp.]|nr:hypothetical protein [Nocardioides sp.]
ADPEAVSAEVDRVLDRLVAPAPDARLVVVSSLAEGADRIVAARVLTRPGARLEVVLPLGADDYATDFAGPDSRREFADLLMAATQVVVVPADDRDPSREAAYARAGTAMLHASDVLLALWDGQDARGRGGTGQVVAEARALGLPVEIVTVERAA